jgi:hypothetical protein
MRRLLASSAGSQRDTSSLEECRRRIVKQNRRVVVDHQRGTLRHECSAPGLSVDKERASIRTGGISALLDHSGAPALRRQALCCKSNIFLIWFVFNKPGRAS